MKATAEKIPACSGDFFLCRRISICMHAKFKKEVRRLGCRQVKILILSNFCIDDLKKCGILFASYKNDDEKIFYMRSV